jgi:hypothetical protein
MALKKTKQRRERGETRNHRICIRVSSQDLEMIRKIARQAGKTMSRAVIEIVEKQAGLISKSEQENDSPTVVELRRIRTEMWRIGHNINQISHNTNRDVNVSEVDEASAHASVKYIERILARQNELIERVHNCRLCLDIHE